MAPPYWRCWRAPRPRPNNIAFGYQIAFGLSGSQAGAMSLQMGPDFGRGGAQFHDGALLAVKTGDLWRSGNYGNSSDPRNRS